MSEPRLSPEIYRPGDLFAGRYRLKRRVGAGGMGVVYLTHDTEVDRDIVLKLLATHLLHDESALARFRREAERLGALSHPNIVELLDAGSDERGQPYIAMEFVDGVSLQRYFSHHPRVDAATFAPIARQLSAAAGYVHSQGIMVRDLKPGNVMLCDHEGCTNVVKLLDFGLAKLVEHDDIDVTQAHVLGTAGYLAPEQIKGEGCDVRVDVYAMGILFFMMLTGRSPINGDSDASLIYNHVHGTPLDLQATLPNDHEVPDAVIELIHQCLAKNPDDRPADGREVERALVAAFPPELLELPRSDSGPMAALSDNRTSIDENPTVKWNRSSIDLWRIPVTLPSGAVPSPPPPPGPQPLRQEDEPRRPRSPLLWKAAAMGGGAALAMLGFWVMGDFEHPEPPSTSATTTPAPRELPMNEDGDRPQDEPASPRPHGHEDPMIIPEPEPEPPKPQLVLLRGLLGEDHPQIDALSELDANRAADLVSAARSGDCMRFEDARAQLARTHPKLLRRLVATIKTPECDAAPATRNPPPPPHALASRRRPRRPGPSSARAAVEDASPGNAVDQETEPARPTRQRSKVQRARLLEDELIR